jgi:hypothetical protein
MKFFALVALALVASANAGTVASFASATRTGTLATGATMAQAGNIVFVFRPTTALVDTNDIIITSTRAMWAADGDAGCTVDQGGAKTVTSALVSGGAGKVLTVKVGAAVANDADVTITCTKNLAALGAAGAETFNLKTSNTDTTDKVCAAPFTVNAGTATWTSAARSVLGATQTTGNFVLSFTTLNAIAADGTFKATASSAMFAADGTDTTCTATCDGTANVVKSSTVADTKTSIEIVLTDACAAAKAVVATCTGNIVNPAAGAITFGFVTSSDIVALTGKTGFTTTTATSAAWTSASRSGFLGTTQAPGDLIVKFTPFKEVPADGTVTITPSANIFTADAATVCTATSDGTAATVKGSATVGAILTVTMTGALAAGKAVVITCTDNLAVNPAAAAITFKLKTSTDATELTGQTGYTVLAAKQALWTSATRASLETGKGGDLVVKFTPTTEVPAEGTLTITADKAIFTADAATTCTATSDGTAAVVKTAGTATVGNVLTVTMTGALAAGKAAVVTCTSNLAVNGAAGTKVGFTFKTSADAGLVSGATGYTVTAVATKAPTKAPTKAGAATGNKTATVAAASTDGVNAGVAFTALCLAATALRQ